MADVVAENDEKEAMQMRNAKVETEEGIVTEMDESYEI